MYSLLCVLDEVDGDKKKLQNLLKLSLQIYTYIPGCDYDVVWHLYNIKSLIQNQYIK